ncbi:hypothetical protein V8F33_012289 [Rhypophila sp. PSN 637]
MQDRTNTIQTRCLTVQRRPALPPGISSSTDLTGSSRGPRFQATIMKTHRNSLQHDSDKNILLIHPDEKESPPFLKDYSMGRIDSWHSKNGLLKGSLYASGLLLIWTMGVVSPVYCGMGSNEVVSHAINSSADQVSQGQESGQSRNPISSWPKRKYSFRPVPAQQHLCAKSIFFGFPLEAMKMQPAGLATMRWYGTFQSSNYILWGALRARSRSPFGPETDHPSESRVFRTGSSGIGRRIASSVSPTGTETSRYVTERQTYSIGQLTNHLPVGYEFRANRNKEVTTFVVFAIGKELGFWPVRGHVPEVGSKYLKYSASLTLFTKLGRYG